MKILGHKAELNREVLSAFMHSLVSAELAMYAHFKPGILGYTDIMIHCHGLLATFLERSVYFHATHHDNTFGP
jgi:hypothetical protein